jgi:SAM-dependent methyltransferase
MRNAFATAEMAAGYAASRPPVHPRVLEMAQARWQRSTPIGRALDVGCGSGLSTKALDNFAGRCFGIDPAETMVKVAKSIAPRAGFAIANAEALPFSDNSIDLIAAAGSLNYVDLPLFFAEAERVLEPGGILLVYDFSPGRSFAQGTALDDWFSTFIDRYPWPPNEACAINPQLLAEVAPRFSVEADRFEIALTLSPEFYLAYMLTETNVAYAVRSGIAYEEIRAWCIGTLHAVWHGADRDVLFRGYFACMKPLTQKSV